MKTNAKRKNSAVKKLIPAAGMLALSASMLATSTYAWFTMNKSVTITGMEMKTVVDNNLLVDNAAPTHGGSWLAGNYATNDTTFENSKTQTINTANVVVPMSSVDGKNFFYTLKDNVAGNGDALSDTYTKYTDDTALKTDYASADTGYLDYHFVLKATNTTNAAAKLIMNDLTLTYSGTTDTNKAFRVAVFAEKFATATVDGAKTLPNVNTMELANIDYKKIFAPTGAANFTSGEAVNATNGTASVTYASAATDGEVATVAANATEYYEVIVRMWIEGEDQTCKVEMFKGLASGSWALSTGFTLDQTQTGVSSLTMATTPTNP